MWYGFDPVNKEKSQYEVKVAANPQMWKQVNQLIYPSPLVNTVKMYRWK
jgi:hypothetical protein